MRISDWSSDVCSSDLKTQRIIEQCRQFGSVPVAKIREQLQWYILRHATGPVISAVHAGTRRSLEEVQTIFADFEQPKIGCHRANVHDVRPNIQHMITDARQLGEKHPQILGAKRHLQSEE